MPGALALLVTSMIANPSAPTLQEFEAVLARHDSATVALEEWCDARRLAKPATVTATLMPPTTQQTPAALADVFGKEALSLRHVRLSCGGTVLSIAWNWYASALLTPQMNAALAQGNVPFGKVIAPLGFRRVALSITAGPANNCPADTISTHQAKLVLPDGRALAYLVECYTAANLAARR